MPKIKADLNKARYAEAKQLCFAFAKAQERYYYEHGKFTDDLSKLDITLPVSASVPGASYYAYAENVNAVSGEIETVAFVLGFNPSDPTDTDRHKMSIWVYADSLRPKVRRLTWYEDDLDLILIQAG